eukprot:TRINITY_DN95622_c0_g1_i1.p2 TRINITY_DN95622_c0_g1~~TRINITY_DN95622_c0_g1_i1.p2  ORF type:complete len:562 (-),score=58.87 TRINITY_DN95622_c0_g1_i1:428-1921(-)
MNADTHTRAWLSSVVEKPSLSKLDLLRREPRKEISRASLDQSNIMSKVFTIQNLEIMSSIDKEALDTWQFDVLRYELKDLQLYVCQMFVNLELTSYQMSRNLDEDIVVPFETLQKFIDLIRKGYNDIPYHNFYHCVDVAHGVYWLLKQIQYQIQFTKEEQLALMVAALSHDLGHGGINNAMLVTTKNNIATTYNDQSVLENSHACSLYRLLYENPEADIFQLFTDEAWRLARKTIIQAILHTDMTNHFPMVSKLQLLVELNQQQIKNLQKRGQLFEQDDNRELLFCVLLHCADIGNPMRPAGISYKWAVRVTDEFFNQGDKEKQMGLTVTPMMDRDTAIMSFSQINFIEVIVAPFLQHIVTIFPEFSECMWHLYQNRQMWGEKYKVEIEKHPLKSREECIEEQQKVTTRLNAFTEKYSPHIREGPSILFQQSFGVKLEKRHSEVQISKQATTQSLQSKERLHTIKVQKTADELLFHEFLKKNQDAIELGRFNSEQDK